MAFAMKPSGCPHISLYFIMVSVCINFCLKDAAVCSSSTKMGTLNYFIFTNYHTLHDVFNF